MKLQSLEILKRTLVLILRVIQQLIKIPTPLVLIGLHLHLIFDYLILSSLVEMMVGALEST